MEGAWKHASRVLDYRWIVGAWKHASRVLDYRWIVGAWKHTSRVLDYRWIVVHGSMHLGCWTTGG